MLGRRILPLVAKIGVRPQLSLVAVIAILPLLALLLVGVVKNREFILQAATTRALDLARLEAERQDNSFQDAKDVLTVLRRLPQVTAASPADCHASIAAIAQDYPQFASIGIVDANGVIVCFSLPFKASVLREADFFKATMAAEPSSFVVSEFQIGHFTGKALVFAGTPLTAAKGEPPPGIAFVAVDLDRAAAHAWDFGEATDATLSLIDTRAATILVRSSDQLNLAGKKLNDTTLTAAMLEHPGGGSVEAVDIDGIPRIFGFAPLITGGGSGLMVAVGLSRAAVFAEADRRLILGVAVALLTALMAAGAAWLFADRTQFRAIRSLVDAAARLGAGDLGARAQMAPWQAPEFRALGQTLGEMADSIARARASLSSSERQLRLLAENSTDMILLVRPGGRRVYASPACHKLLGYTPEEMLAINTLDSIHRDDAGFLESLKPYSIGDAQTFVYRMRRKDGSYVWVESVSRVIVGEDGQPPQRLAVVRDIDQRVAAERNLRESELRYRFLAENGADMVFQYDLDLVRQYVSPACREILGYAPEEMIGVRALGTVHPEDAEHVAQLFQSVVSGQAERAVVVNRLRHRDGRWIWVEAQLRGLKDQNGALCGIIGALRDISVRKAAEDKLEEANRRLEALAGQDGLTALANRRTFDDALAREYRRALRDGSSLATIMIDVDRFKAFNDNYGHPAGDECLRRVGRAIESMLARPGDIVARYGGEEFAVLLPNTDEAGAANIAERIRVAVLALAIEHRAGPAIVVSISAGVASFAPNAQDIELETVMHNADRALYRAKHNGRNAVVCASSLPKPFAKERPSAA